jgi:hypothetical protein
MVDTISTVVDLLNDNWTSGNTDDITPTITAIFEKKRVDGFTIKSYVGVYLPSAAEERTIDLGYNNVDRVERASIDIRTSESYSHLLNCRDEAKRILRANRKATTGFDIVRVTRLTDLSDATRKLWRWIIDLELLIYAEAVS